MKMNCLAVLTCLVALLVCTIHADTVCKTESLCKCDTDKGMIDLSPLAARVLTCNNAQGSAQFKYSPCRENVTQPCQDALMCRATLVDHSTIAKASGQHFVKTNAGQIAVEYQGEDNSTTTTVVLNCDQSTEGELMMLNDQSKNYTFQLNSRYACIGGPQITTTNSPKSTSTPKSKSTKTTSKSTTPRKTTAHSTSTPKSQPTTKTTPKSTKTTQKTTPHSTHSTPKTTSHSTHSTPKTTPHSTHSTPKTTMHSTSPKTPTTPKIHSTTHGAASNSLPKMMVIAAIVFIGRCFV